MLNVSKPTRILKPDEYNATDVATFGLDPPRMVVRVFASNSKADAVAFGEATPAQNAQYVVLKTSVQAEQQGPSTTMRIADLTYSSKRR